MYLLQISTPQKIYHSSFTGRLLNTTCFSSFASSRTNKTSHCRMFCCASCPKLVTGDPESILCKTSSFVFPFIIKRGDPLLSIANTYCSCSSTSVLSRSSSASTQLIRLGADICGVCFSGLFLRNFPKRPVIPLLLHCFPLALHFFQKFQSKSLHAASQAVFLFVDCADWFTFYCHLRFPVQFLANCSFFKCFS